MLPTLLPSSRTLTDWLSYITTLNPNLINLGLERIAQVAVKLDLQRFKVPVITIAGTNGKGSSAAMLAAIYQACGYCPAMYTSPHLLNFTERLHIQNQPLAEALWCDAFCQVEQARQTVKLTYFEFSTLAALLLIKQQPRVDVIILEVGMGGRLDAVNIVEPDLSIITSIALDHTEYLGTDREMIGYEKAGIFRPHKPAVCGDPSVPTTVTETAHRLNSLLFCQQQDFWYSQLSDNIWSWSNQQLTLVELPMPILPLQNAATILQAVYLLQSLLPVSLTAIKQGLITARLDGRMQPLVAAPIHTILDVAHNPHAAHLLVHNLTGIKPVPTGWHAVVGMLKDKDIAGTLAPLVPLITHWHLASLISEPRGAPAQLLAQALATYSATSLSCFDTPRLAYQAALKQALPDQAIVVFGSFYTLADVLTFAHEQQNIEKS